MWIIWYSSRILNALHFKFASQHKSNLDEVLIHLLWYMLAHLLQLRNFNFEQRMKWLIKMYHFLEKWGARHDSRPSWCRDALPYFEANHISLLFSHSFPPLDAFIGEPVSHCGGGCNDELERPFIMAIFSGSQTEASLHRFALSSAQHLFLKGVYES